MFTQDNFQVTAGSALVIDAVLNSAPGIPATGFDGSETLETEVWPGGDRTASFAATTTWTDPAAAAVAIAFTAAETLALSPGHYQLVTYYTVPGQDRKDGYGCTIDIAGGPGTAAAPRTYADYATLLRYGRSWLRQLQTDDDEAGFAEQLGRARSWLEDCGHAHYRTAGMAVVVGGQAMGPRRSGARSPWLQEQFDADKLMVTDQVREACAKKALAFICEGQVGIGGASGEYARLAKVYHSQADYLATCMTLQLDTDGDGFADVVIDLSSTDPFYG